MKNLFDVKKLPGAVGALGLVSFLVRWGLYAFGTDEKGLLLSRHPLEPALWAAAAVTAALVIAAVRKLDGSNRYEHNFGPSMAAAGGSAVFACGILITILTGGEIADRLDLACRFFGLLSAAALAGVAVYRAKGKQPFFLLHCVVCVYLALYMVNHYRPWSGDPQLQDYVFRLIAVICLTLFAYYQTAFSVGMGKRRMQLAAGLLGLYACVTALAYAEDLPLYLTGAVWCLTNLCSFEPVPKEPEETEENKETGEEA